MGSEWLFDGDAKMSFGDHLYGLVLFAAFVLLAGYIHIRDGLFFRNV